MDITHQNDALRSLLATARRIAVVGCSNKPDRDSYRIAQYLIEAGYDVVPVNPVVPEILSRKCYPDVTAIPEPVDIVDVFRSPEHLPGVVDDAIRARARAVWMQLGAGNPTAAATAVAAGLHVVVEQCIMVVHRTMQIPRVP